MSGHFAMHDNAEEMTGVTEYGECLFVELARTMGALGDRDDKPRMGHGRYVIRAYNEAGYCWTEVDVLELVAWLRAHHPELLK
jgi:hypothetical protein